MRARPLVVCIRAFDVGTFELMFQHDQLNCLISCNYLTYYLIQIQTVCYSISCSFELTLLMFLRTHAVSYILQAYVQLKLFSFYISLIQLNFVGTINFLFYIIIIGIL